MRRIALVISLLFPASLLFPTQTFAEDPHGPKLIYGAPVRHTLTSCSTNPGQAVACIQSVTLTPKSGDAPISGVTTDLKVPGDSRIADSERPIPAPDAATLAAGAGSPMLSIFEKNACHSIGTLQSLQIKNGSNWIDLKKATISAQFSESCDAKTSVAGFKFTQEELKTLLAGSAIKDSNILSKLTEVFDPKSAEATISQNEIRFRVAAPNGAWEWFSPIGTSFLWSIGLPGPKVTRGFYNEWTFPKGKESSSANNVVVMSEFQPYKATWCWAADVCNDRREEFSLAINPSRDKDLLKNNPNYSFTVTIRAPKSFEFGEVSGSAKQVIVKYGKDLQTVGGVATREIIATLSPIATARGGTPTQMAEKATMISYGANIWIYGQNNGIVDGLGPCGKIGGVQVVSNAMHSLDPTWDAKEEAIAVRLSTPHLLPDGSINVGYLEVRMPRAAALCMWKVDLDGSIKASVSISYEDGSAPTVATVSGKRVGDDYLIVSAGFHYSSPTLRVKLGQSKATDVQTEATDVQTEATDTQVKVTDTQVKVTDVQKIVPVKKMTIKCKKGNLTKKVTAVKPACPSGYKKI